MSNAAAVLRLWKAHMQTCRAPTVNRTCANLYGCQQAVVMTVQDYCTRPSSGAVSRCHVAVILLS
jgi:hypothetical protein